ncbi:protein DETOXIFICATION 56 [Gastrolobium bilobum]|uniref:protein DETOXIFICATION 56 n=1 Tax=Gastrolobium bilobum TaxID=150636 RepID=UPI002AB1F08F|nr:protein DETOXIFICATION 56 [Gastrolobium bilobum]
MSATSKLRENLSLNGKTMELSLPPPPLQPQKCSANMVEMVLSELRVQRRIVLPMVAMNLAWFAKTAITTAFLGRLGELSLAGGALGFTFANVTGFSVLNGLCGAMEPICGQAHGAKNLRLLHKTLLMTILLLLLATLPITFLWLHVDKILIYFGQQQDISAVARTYVSYLIPDLFITSLFCPLKAYLNSQSITLPTMFSSAIALAFHIPVNIVLSKTMGLKGVSMSVWITDLIVVVLLAIYVVILENRKANMWKEGGWWDQSIIEWIRLIKLCGSCCLNTCLEWWCYEILVLLTGHLANAKQAVGIFAIVLNFDYLLFSVMLSLATCVSTRVSNELGANQAGQAYRSARVSLALGFIAGCIGSLVMVAARGIWGPLFSHDRGIIKGVKKTMLVMALVEVFNFPLAVSGGIVRGTARPWLGMYANIAGFYFLALPLGAVFAFKLRLGLVGLFIGLITGIVTCLTLLLVFIARINWMEEAAKAQTLASSNEQVQEVPKYEAEERIESQENNQA